MKIKQLGNGGGFDFDKTNSSFLISPNKAETQYLLFDCGFNIMERLKSEKYPIDISKIKTVYISHMDEDHVGNLKMLIYWRYFMCGKAETKVLCHFSLKDTLSNYLKEISSELVGCHNTHANMYSLTVITERKDNYGVWNLQATPAFHGKVNCHGLIIGRTGKGQQAVFISGDTKASRVIEDTVKEYEANYGKCYKFHDYSNWDCVTRNVHACKTDYEIEYSKEWRESTIKYHTGEAFDCTWQTIIGD